MNKAMLARVRARNAQYAQDRADSEAAAAREEAAREEAASRPRGGGHRPRGGDREDARRGGDREDARYKKLAKFLVYLCRHGAEDCGLEIDEDGWVDMSATLNLRPIWEEGFGAEDIRWCADHFAGGRLELYEDETGSWIRCYQGHSVKISDKSFPRVQRDDTSIPQYLIHGTSDAAWLSIEKEGLKPMGRQHVHMACTVDKVQQGSTVHVYVDKNAVLDRGTELLVAKTNVILSRDIIPASCFVSAWHVLKERELLQAAATEWVDEQVIIENTRWKQIRLGKNTREYAVWQYSSEEDKLEWEIPEPPNPSPNAMGKRQFLRELSAWRRALHQYQEWLENKHWRARSTLPPLKRSRGSVARRVAFSGTPGQSSVRYQ
jgi:RNA:NAD 2'-phosphotransferase (TPT1/KptA family)